MTGYTTRWKESLEGVLDRHDIILWDTSAISRDNVLVDKLFSLRQYTDLDNIEGQLMQEKKVFEWISDVMHTSSKCKAVSGVVSELNALGALYHKRFAFFATQYCLEQRTTKKKKVNYHETIDVEDMKEFPTSLIVLRTVEKTVSRLAYHLSKKCVSSPISKSATSQKRGETDYALVDASVQIYKNGGTAAILTRDMDIPLILGKYHAQYPRTLQRELRDNIGVYIVQRASYDMVRKAEW